MLEVQANTQIKVVVGPIVAVGDGFTPVTNLALGTADEAELMKHDASAVVDISGNTFAAITNMDGYYNLTLTTTDTNTEGMAVIGINDDSLCLPYRMEIMVLAQAAWASKYTAKDSGYMDVHVKTLEDIDFGATMKASINTEVDNALNTAIPGSPTANSINERVAAIDDLTQASGAGDLAAILTDTAEIGAAGAGLTEAGGTGDQLTAIPWNANWDAEVQSEANDALVAFFTSAANLVDLVWEEAIADHSGTAGSTAEQLAAAGGAGDPWNTALPGSYTSGKAGYILSIIHKILKNNYAIIDNQLIIYDDDGSTALFTYDLKRDGSATEFNPDSREVV